MRAHGVVVAPPGLDQDLGLSQADQLPGGRDAPDTGGTLVALTPGLLFSLRTNWLLRLAQRRILYWLPDTKEKLRVL